jgi:tRNA pseudouridine55 synthase
MAPLGLLNLRKPVGLTSRRVVDQVQRLVKPAKVGHAGTLDPLAHGVLVVGVGSATRLLEYVQQMPKLYRAEFLLGRTSTTEDIEGEITLRPDSSPPTLESLRSAARELTGAIKQRPPAFSALKVSGRRAYDLARRGEAVELAPRTVQVYRIAIVRYDYPQLELDVECGAGTYVRSLGRDLADRCGSGAVMAALERTRIGPFTIDAATDAATLSRENLGEYLLSPMLAVRGLMPECQVTDSDARRLANGLSVVLSSATSDECAAIDRAGRLIGILARRGDGQFAPTKNFAVDL